MKISLDDAIKRYGKIDGWVWEDECHWCSMLEIPESIGKNWINSATGRPVTHIYCNADMKQALIRALLDLESQGLLGELKTFDGCFCIRDVRAEPGKPSCHSYALAIDLNASTNKLGEEPSLSPAFVKCFTDQGFTWGGTFKRKDGMHFSFAWE